MITIDTIYALIGVFIGGNILQAIFRVDAKRQDITLEPHDLDYLDFRHSVYMVVFWVVVATSCLYYHSYPMPYYLKFKGDYSIYGYHTLIVMFMIYLGAWFNYRVYRIFFRE